eukprot:CAMPEP_0178737572 /NCGR_PEP_ID=MMETSP0744-20121128/3048_1 /TAXON_ID=913974 /ORGANISM="Nitzschia punctata, Strain CCMP561" /LENGTH=196 /DNA_ID=CAMNT_0020390127 /DNA_START=5 /DNA_END=596 /DNA_ORIENTATION=+
MTVSTEPSPLSTYFREIALLVSDCEDDFDDESTVSSLAKNRFLVDRHLTSSTSTNSSCCQQTATRTISILSDNAKTTSSHHHYTVVKKTGSPTAPSPPASSPSSSSSSRWDCSSNRKDCLPKLAGGSRRPTFMKNTMDVPMTSLIAQSLRNRSASTVLSVDDEENSSTDGLERIGSYLDAALDIALTAHNTNNDQA